MQNALKAFLLLFLLLAGCYDPSAPHYDEVCLGSPNHSQGLYVFSDDLWPSPVIPVCWEEAAYNYPQYQQWVEEAAKGSWEAVSLVEFINWDECTPDSDGVRINISPAKYLSFVYGKGYRIDGKKDGVVISSKWQLSINPEAFIKYSGVHEFGHVLGFSHEHNRKDTPAYCNLLFAAQGADGDLVTGEWDPYSVMNYCSVPYMHGRLSCGDIEGVQQMYGRQND